MSTFNAATTIITAIRRPTQAELVEDAIAGMVDTHLSEWVGSAQLDALAQPAPAMLAGGRGPAITETQESRLDASERRWDAIASSTLTRSLVSTAAGPDLAKASSLLGASRAALGAHDRASADALATAADDLMRTALRTTADRLRVDERHLAGDAVGRALQQLGYEIDLEQGSRATGVWATRDDTAVAVLVQDGGVMELDWAGYAGDACRPALAELTAQLAAEGVECRTTRTVHHGDERGGQLIGRAVAAAQGGRLATGLVTQFERGLPVADRSSAATAAVLPRSVRQ